MKNILNYLVCLAVAVFLMKEISGTGGVFIIAIMAAALIISLVIFFVSVKIFNVNMKLSTEILDKGDCFEAIIEVSRRGIVPTCFVEVEIGYSPNIGKAEPDQLTKVKVVSAKRGGDLIRIPLKAEYCAMGIVYIKSVTLIDYMGIAKKAINCDKCECEVKIIPGVPDTGTQTEVLKSTSENITFDDSDEESDETAIGLTGTPGYEHRKYFMGDPLKRVNWKLSSKKGELMVRLDEKTSASSQVFILDYPACEDEQEVNYKNADMIIEASLAMMSMLLRSGFESEYSYFSGTWQTVEVKDEISLRYVQQELASIKPYDDVQRLKGLHVEQKGKAVTCFTACTGQMQKQLSFLQDEFNGSLVVTKLSGIGRIQNDMWMVDDDFEFSKIQ